MTGDSLTENSLKITKINFDKLCWIVTISQVSV